MTPRTEVITWPDGHQTLICLFDDGHLTAAERPEYDRGARGPPVGPDPFYRNTDPRPVSEVVALLMRDGEFVL